MTLLNDFERPEIIEMEESDQRYLQKAFESAYEEKINLSTEITFDPLLLKGFID